ncbi:MAG TPA: ABC transporter permease [Acidimicrobiales bacterium]|nr:ABC transporter permease [Acidimicrobiales bacterium]
MDYDPAAAAAPDGFGPPTGDGADATDFTTSGREAAATPGAAATATDTPPHRTRDRIADLVVSRPLLRQTEREARVWVRTWKGSLVSGLLTPLLFLGAMGLGLGGLVDENSGDVAGLSYLVFVAPGILAAAAMQSAAADALWPVMSGVKWTKTYHAASATPLAPSDVYGGYLVWMAVRLAMNATAFLVVAALLGGVPSAWGVFAVPAAVAGALAFAAPLAAYSASQDSDLAFPIIMRIVVMPMFLFSGTFFAVEQLPAGIRPLAWVTPLWHAVELARGATTGSLGLAAVAGHVAFLAACIAAGAWWGARTFGRRLAA